MARGRDRAPAATLLGAFVALALGGCASTLTDLRSSGLPERVRVAGVPVLVQTEDHCGPTSLSALLTWAGQSESPDALAALVYLPGRSGTLPIDLAREIRARGLLSYRTLPRLEALLGELAAGHPALVLENRGLSWFPVWHYSVLTGYDLGARKVVLHGGDPYPEGVDVDRFRRTWERGGSFALLALPPTDLPATDDPEGTLGALADLEEVGQVSAAAKGYEAFVQRWPADWRGAFGWGNARYALGDPAGAERAFRLAHDIAPGRPEPLNNLALLALASGRRAEAAALAARAVDRAAALGVDLAPYEDTRRAASPP